eukprot:365981-Chlamydomonas_euryale.AAC.22
MPQTSFEAHASGCHTAHPKVYPRPPSLAGGQPRPPDRSYVCLAGLDSHVSDEEADKRAGEAAAARGAGSDDAECVSAGGAGRESTNAAEDEAPGAGSGLRFQVRASASTWA